MTDIVLAPAVHAAPAHSRVPLWRRLLRSRSGRVGLILTGIVVVAAIAAYLGLTPYDPISQRPADRFAAPDASYLLGTDQFGRDLLSRVAAGAGTSLLVAVTAVAIAAVVGTTAGVVAGYFGPPVSPPILGVANVLFAFPPLLLALALASAFKRDWFTVAIAIAIVYVPIFIRVARGPVLSLRDADFVRASQVLGFTTSRILFRHVLPNIAPIIIVQVTLALSWAVLTEAALSFVGLGTPPPTPALGSMILEARQMVASYAWTMLAPGAMIVMFVVGLNLLGDGLRDALDPALRDRRVSVHESLDALLTEQVDPRYAQLDRASVVELAALMNEADASVPAAIGAAMGSIVPAIEAITARLAQGGRLRYVGAGTAGRLGVLDASECPPTFGVPPDLVQGIIAGGPDAITDAVEGAEDDLDAGSLAIAEAGIGPSDAVVGVAASGRTPFVMGALREARARGALTVALSCNTQAPISREAELAIEVPVGPEILAGSTRLKAGTAQKLVLNMISTIAMVRLGKTWGNLMVDLRATNEKLRERAIRIVQQVTGASREAAVVALEAADWEVKPAALMVGRGLTVDEARGRLAADGRLRVALEEAP